MEQAQYRISSRDYLRRAGECLAEGSSKFLFYAAFELRCGIEARMNEYLEVWEHISKKKKKGWRIAEMGRNVEKAFKTGNKIVRWAVHDKSTNELIVCLYYTPVTSALKKSGEKLGNYLHSMKRYKVHTDQFWLRFRNDLESAYEKLAIANTGTLLGPPLMKSGTGQVDMKVELPTEGQLENPLTSIMKAGKEIKINVSYILHLPNPIEK
ncbi:MAG: hypothetical protein GXP09_09480 [Gammaproteobacteria bacterium]|nr:hypothetical protein [Gammaproteobacteria bacterium]